MTTPEEVTVVGIGYWASRPQQLAHLLASSPAPAISDPSGTPAAPDQIAVVALPALWAADLAALGDALAFALADIGVVPATGRSAGAVARVEDRLVFTVEEAAQLLGISRSFAYEAVQRREIPSMRIGRRILVPKAALDRFLAQGGTESAPSA
jgi:excisionase family DNA binding protein